MTRGNASRRWWNGRFAVPVGLAVMGLSLCATDARAGCMDPGKAVSAPTAFLKIPAPVPELRQDVGVPGQPATIVGLWHVIYTATESTAGPLPVPVIPPGEPFLMSETMKTWHADGTEWEEKLRPGHVGFCFGVWEHTAKGSAKLHHFGAITTPDGTVAFIFYEDEINRVAPDGRSYSGTFDFKVYAATDVFGSGPMLQEIKGTTAATRITVDGF